MHLFRFPNISYKIPFSYHKAYLCWVKLYGKTAVHGTQKKGGKPLSLTRCLESGGSQSAKEGKLFGQQKTAPEDIKQVKGKAEKGVCYSVVMACTISVTYYWNLYGQPVDTDNKH